MDKIVNEIKTQRYKSYHDQLKGHFDNNQKVAKILADGLKEAYFEFEMFFRGLVRKYTKQLEQAKLKNKPTSYILTNLLEAKEATLEYLHFYIGQIPDSPTYLPLMNNIYIEDIDETIQEIVVYKLDTVEDLDKALQAYFKSQENSIDLTKAFYKVKKVSYERDINGVVEEKKTELILNKKDELLKEYDIVPGEVIILTGNYILEKPLGKKECMSYNFSGSVTMDYFSCDDCGISWICDPCKKYCHVNHSVSLFKPNYKATHMNCKCNKKNCIIKNQFTLTAGQ